jgi:hypothetical protein
VPGAEVVAVNWNVLGLAFIVFTVAGPLTVVLFLGITGGDET